MEYTDEELERLAKAEAVPAGKHAGEAEATGPHGPHEPVIESPKMEAVAAQVDEMIARLDAEAIGMQDTLDARAQKAKARAAVWAGVRTACQAAGVSLGVVALPAAAASWGDVATIVQAFLLALVNALVIGLLAGVVAFLQWIARTPDTAVKAGLAADRAARGLIPADESERIHRDMLGFAREA